MNGELEELCCRHLCDVLPVGLTDHLLTLQ